MPVCNFTIPFSADPLDILAKAKSAVENQNGFFNGDINSGNFEVTLLSNFIKGNYSIAGKLMNIVISDKPFFVPCSTIEGFLKSKLS